MVDTKKAARPSAVRHSKANSPDLKRFVYRLIGFTSVQLIISLIFIVPYLLKYDDAVNQGYAASTIDKHKLLRESPSPRIIFVGGSAVAFGIHSAEFQKKLAYHPVNMGIQAGLGAEYMLNEVKPDLRSGDVVVVSLEYESFINFPPEPLNLINVLEARKENVAAVPVGYASPILDQGLIWGGSFLRRSVELMLSDKLQRQPFYSRKGFNEFGDVVAHYSVPNDASKLAGEARYYRFKPENIQRTIQALNQFHQWCQAKGVQVFYTYPPLMPTLLKMNQQEIAKVETALSQSLTFPILGTPSEVALSDDLYFDTRYHLNQAGGQRRSRYLSEKLLPYLSRK